MKKIVAAIALCLPLFACAAETSDSQEETATVSQDLTSMGYCDVDTTTQLLTGKCRSSSGAGGMCCLKTSVVCGAGATPGGVGASYSASCGGVLFYDTTRRCTNYC